MSGAAPDGAEAASGEGGRAVSLAVDARGLNMSGIGRYLREHLAAILHDARFGRVMLLGQPAELDAFLRRHGGVRPGVEVVPFGYRFYDPRAHAHWAALATRGALRADAAFFPHYDVPLAGRLGRYLVAVQDLSHFRLPEVFPAWKRAFASQVLRRAVSRARRVAVSSQSGFHDLVERHPSVRPKTHVIPLGVDAPRPGLPTPGALARAEALRPYLLCVGNRKPHKNLVAAVEALARLRPSWPGLRLVLAGHRFAEGDGVEERAAALGIASAVVDAGPVSDDDLAALYQRAECLLFPSLYEGFGLPVLEAMAQGTPVVASNRASIPEVAGDAAALADPTDAQAWADAVARLARDAGARARAVRLGRERAATFTWARTTQRTLALLLETAGHAAR